MKNREENEETWRKIEKSEEKWLQNKDSIHMPSETPDTHTQMAHGKKSWNLGFVATFLHFFCFCSFFSTMLKSGEKLRKVEKNEEIMKKKRRKSAWGTKALRLWDHPQI